MNKKEMSDANSKRRLVKIVREICADEGIEFKAFSYDWILQLTKGSKSMFIYGYQFPSNDAAAELICSDKAALAYVLLGNGVEAVQHQFFMSPANLHYTEQSGNWAPMCALLNRHKKLVIKRNSGSGGSGVYIVENQGQLEAVTTEIFRTARSLSVSPYYDIINEYRTIYCFGEPLLIYKKIRPYVTGDGKHTLYELVASAYNGDMEIADNRLDKSYVPANGEVVTISWKHNLGQGAEAELIDKESEIYAKIFALAKKAAECVNINFASIDIIDTAEGLKILEINSGIMMENFSSYDEENYNIAKSIYKRAIDRYFETH